MKLQQANLDQTGVAILEMKGSSEEKILPLFSLNPVGEAQEVVKYYFPECETIRAVYFTNNLMEVKIEDIINKFRETSLALPENYMEELLSGFPFIIGNEVGCTTHYYA